MKKLLAFTLTAILCLSLVTFACAAGERVFDQAELLSPSEEREIMERIQTFQKNTNVDFVVLTSDTEHKDASQQQIADEFYIRGGFGLDEENSGVLYYVDMYDRYQYLMATGVMNDYLTDQRKDDAIERATSALSGGRYAQACLAMIDQVEKDVKAGIPEGQYRYDVVTGQRLTARHKALTTGEIAVCALIALAAALIFSLSVSASYKLKGSTYDYDYQANCKLKLTDREDTYLRTTTTQTRRPDPPTSGGGGGGFGGGGGTGVHTGSNGSSFSGRGGSF